MEATTNNAVVSGRIASGFEYSHEAYGERFFTFFIECRRLSGINDILPVTVSERLTGSDYKPDDYVEITGQIRSYNSYADGRTKLILTIFARDMCHIDPTDEPKNQIELNGFICKPCVYRTTPFGRKIADILLAVNRSYNKSDYIPCICWGRNAVFANRLETGNNILLTGRMQSRIYQKKLSETEVIEKTAYEVSVSRAELIIPEEKAD